MPVQRSVQRRKPGANGCGVGPGRCHVTCSEHRHEVAMSLLQPCLSVPEVVVDDAGELRRERVEPRQPLPLAELERAAGDKLAEFRLVDIGGVQRHDQVPVAHCDVPVGHRLYERVVGLLDLAPLARGQRPVVALHLVDVDAAVVQRHEHVDTAVANAGPAPRRPLVLPAQQHRHDRFHVLAGTTDQRAGHGTTSADCRA